MTAKDGWELFEQQGGKCKLTGLPIHFPSDGKEFGGTASLDRIDSTKGYVKANVQWVHKDVNIMKNKFSQEYFLHVCQLIVHNFKG